MNSRILLVIFLAMSCSSFQESGSLPPYVSPLVDRVSWPIINPVTDGCNIGQQQWLVSPHPVGMVVTHWDGSKSSRQVIDVNRTLDEKSATNVPMLSCVSSSDIWAFSGKTWVSHWDGSTWVKQPFVADLLNAVSANEIWYVSSGKLYKGNGTSWLEQVTPGGAITALWANSGGIWIAAGSTYHLINNTWVAELAENGMEIAIDVMTKPDSLGHRWGVTSYVAGVSYLYHWENVPGNMWRWKFITAVPYSKNYRAIGVNGDSDIWLGAEGKGGGNSMIHWDGTKVTNSSLPESSPVGFNRFWQDDSGTLWGIPIANSVEQNIGNGESFSQPGGPLLRLENGIWHSDQSAKLGIVYGLKSLYAISQNEVWVVGDLGIVLRYKDGNWQFIQSDLSPVTTLRALWGRNSNDVWAVGTGGAIFHYTGKEKMEVITPNAAIDLQGLNFIDVKGNDSEVWLVIENDKRTLRFDGTNWTVHYFVGDTGDTGGAWYQSNHSLCSFGSGNTWNLTQYGLWQFDGASWHQVSLPKELNYVASNQNKIFCLSDGELWIADTAAKRWIVWDGKIFQQFHKIERNDILLGIWGTSANELWGINSLFYSDNTTESIIWQFKGNAWQTINPYIDASGNYETRTYLDIHGVRSPWVLAKIRRDKNFQPTYKDTYDILEWATP